MSAPIPPSCAKTFDAGASALERSVQTLVVTTHPRTSTPPMTPSDKTKSRRPITTASQSSVHAVVSVWTSAACVLAVGISGLALRDGHYVTGLPTEVSRTLTLVLIAARN